LFSPTPTSELVTNATLKSLRPRE